MKISSPHPARRSSAPNKTYRSVDLSPNEGASFDITEVPSSGGLDGSLSGSVAVGLLGNATGSDAVFASFEAPSFIGPRFPPVEFRLKRRQMSLWNCRCLF